MKNSLVLFFGCLVSLLSAQQFETGVVIDSLPVSSSTKETFALYLPINYDSTQPLPILFVFSPSGNGKQGVEVFVQAAEAYNHILVSSNNTRNGPLDRNLQITQRLFSKVFSQFNILENRIYLAGFSGGSRLASAIATTTDQIDGVIACGAGFSSSLAHTPTKQSFSYAGICGDRDMNYNEMIKVNGYLKKLQFTNTLFTFDGNHQWPPNEQILMAFEWLEAEAVKKGYLKKPHEEIKVNLLKALACAKIAKENNQPLIEFEQYERVFYSYSSLFNMDSIQLKLQNIKKNKRYISTLKSRNKAFEKEEMLTSMFLKRFEKDCQNTGKVNLKWWEKEFEKLKKKEGKASSQMIKMLERLKFKVFVMAYQRGQSNSKQKDFCNSIVSLFYPNKN